MEVRFLAGGRGGVGSGALGRSAVVASTMSPSRGSRGGCSVGFVGGTSGVKSGVAYCVFGWCRTKRGKKEFSRTKLAPKHVFAMIAKSAPSRYTFGTIARNRIIVIDPINANSSSNLFR